MQIERVYAQRHWGLNDVGKRKHLVGVLYSPERKACFSFEDQFDTHPDLSRNPLKQKGEIYESSTYNRQF